MKHHLVGSRARPSRRNGTLVYSFDGKRIGELAAVAGDHLKVHRRLGRDYWIPDVLVRRRLGHEVILHVDRRTISRYRRPGPPVHPRPAPARPDRRAPMLGGSVFIIVLLLAAASFAFVACSDDAADPGRADAASSPVAAGSDEALVIIVTADGFAPDSLEVVRGGRITIRNDSDDTLSVVVRGTGDAGDPQEVGPGDVLDLPFHDLGAQVLTIADDPDSTATIMVVPPDASE